VPSEGPWLRCSAEAPPVQQCDFVDIPGSCIYASAECADTWSIHREAPEFTEQSTEQEILATGIKVGNNAFLEAAGFRDRVQLKILCRLQQGVEGGFKINSVCREKARCGSISRCTWAECGAAPEREIASRWRSGVLMLQ